MFDSCSSRCSWWSFGGLFGKWQAINILKPHQFETFFKLLISDRKRVSAVCIERSPRRKAKAAEPKLDRRPGERALTGVVTVIVCLSYPQQYLIYLANCVGLRGGFQQETLGTRSSHSGSGAHKERVVYRQKFNGSGSQQRSVVIPRRWKHCKIGGRVAVVELQLCSKLKGFKVWSSNEKLQVHSVLGLEF